MSYSIKIAPDGPKPKKYHEQRLPECTSYEKRVWPEGSEFGEGIEIHLDPSGQIVKLPRGFVAYVQNSEGKTIEAIRYTQDKDKASAKEFRS